MKTKAILLAIPLAFATGLHVTAQTGPNGTAARPFYVIGHNPNTLEDAELALKAGANALEPDLMVLPAGSKALPNFEANPTGIVLYHDHAPLTSRVPLTMEQYFDGVHDLAIKYPDLAMILLDVKTAAAKKENGPKILKAVREHLNTDGVNLNVIISVAEHDPDGELFTDILSDLGEREGVQIDEEDRADQVVAFLAGANNGNIGYGDGTIGQGPNLPRAVDLASFYRASVGFPRVISDVFVIEFAESMDFFIEAGADGIIPDLPNPLHPEFSSSYTPAYIALLKAIVLAKHPEVRLATREDNPFKPKNQAYGVQIRTMDEQDAGTNADLTFTLTGCRGSSSVTYDTGFVYFPYSTGRMEQGNTDWVTIPSLYLGRLTSLEIKNDGSGVAEDWDLQDVAVSSARWLFPNFGRQFEYQAALNGTVEGGKSVKLDLTPNFTEPPPTIQCPAPIVVNNAPGQCSAPVSFTPKVDGMCLDVTAISTPASGSTFDVGTTNVSSYAKSASNPQPSPACSFTVTVKDVEGPQISCPAPIVADATSPQGVAVTFAPTVKDNCSASVTSAPASGSVFAIGDTNVSSTAQDPSGNQSSCSFTVHVKGAAEQLADLIAEVNNLTTKPGTKNALLVKLNAALAKVGGDQIGPICGPLQDFINFVSAQTGKDISAADAASLIAKATQIRAVVGCTD